MGHLKLPYDTKLILDDQGGHLDSQRINLESFKGPLELKPITGQVLFLDIW